MMATNTTLLGLDSFNETVFSNETIVDLMQYTEYKIARWLNRSTPWIALVVALLGNSAAFVTVIKMKPFTTVALFICYLAVTDTLFVLSNFIYTQLTRDNIALGNAGCSLLLFIINYTVFLANWTVVTMTAERFAAVCYPLGVAQMFTMRKSVIILVILGVLWVFPCQFAIWIYQEINHPHQVPYCGERPEYATLTEILRWTDLMCYAMIPCGIIIILNIGIIRKVAQSRKLRQEVSNAHALLQPHGAPKKARESVRHGHLTAMLITVSIAYVFLQLPIAIFYLTEKYWNYQETTRDRVVYYLVREVMHTLSDLNHSLNFVFYFLGGRKFRHRFVELLTCGALKRGFRIRLSGESTSRGITDITQTSTVPVLDISVDSQGSVYVSSPCKKHLRLEK